MASGGRASADGASQQVGPFGEGEGEVSEVALGEVFRIGRAYLAHTAGGVSMEVWTRWCVRPSRAMGPGSPR